jgi:hypothetical protein
VAAIKTMVTAWSRLAEDVRGFGERHGVFCRYGRVDGCAEDTNAEVRATGMAKVEESREGDEMKE